MSDYSSDISKIIADDLEMHMPESLSDEDMLRHISHRVDKLLKADPDLLMSYLYRLDVEQIKIEAALETSVFPAHVTLANLIWERQKQRIESKLKYKQDPIEGWEF